MYIPLQFYEQTNLNNIPPKQPIKPYLLQMIGDDDMFRDLCLDPNLFTDKVEGEISGFSNEIRDHWKTVYKWASGYDPKHSVFTVKYKCFVRNNFIHMVVANRWSKFKKVYKFDPELELTLCDVDKISIPISLLYNLPYRNFYLQFAEEGIFSKNFHGCYVSFIETEKTMGLYFCRVNYSHHSMGGFLEFDKGIDDNAIVLRSNIDWRLNNSSKNMNPDICVDWEDFCFFAINAILYLCAANAEVEEGNPDKYPKINGSMARAEREVGNKDDIQYFECGYRYGNTIRLMKRGGLQDTDTSVDISNITTLSTKKRKAPRPHPVRASWQHYWVGHGDDKQRILKFKAPYYQGGISKVATISKVK